ncbi:hypothetical protein GF380_02690 [Candidatus Uhrbacteria bacterium]|nr:hypothetical protein [Candidatus Uhrbacteria bacterium]MBD3284070.1 hypothetical protein [Candidatus Uhrbacteria bacterium]
MERVPKLILIADSDTVQQKRTIRRIHEIFMSEDEDDDVYHVIAVTSFTQALLALRNTPQEARIALILELEDERDAPSSGRHADHFELELLDQAERLLDRPAQMIFFTRNEFPLPEHTDTPRTLTLRGEVCDVDNWKRVARRLRGFLHPDVPKPSSIVLEASLQ